MSVPFNGAPRDPASNLVLEQMNHLHEPASRCGEIDMSKSRILQIVTLGLSVAGVLSGCATFEKCGFNGCPGDAKITADVKTLFDQHPELGTSIDVQTLDHVVYLYGLVDTPFESEIAKSVAVQAPGVTRVVSTIASGN
jgi:osmotically-inducible protein OsmY